VTWPDGSFTDEQIAILRAEPALVVHLGAVSGDDDKLKTHWRAFRSWRSSSSDVTADRDQLLVTLELQESESVARGEG
jgi:hypothetical protein